MRKKLGVRADEGVWCYVNNVFAPGLDEGVGGLWKVSGVGEWGKEGGREVLEGCEWGIGEEGRGGEGTF